MSLLEDVEALYDARPYPQLGFLAPLVPLRRDDLPLLNYRAGYACSFGDTEGIARQPRILVAGCGTFEPVAVAAANPGAEIVAVDLSAKALGRLKRHLRWRGLTGKVRLHHGDFTRLSRSEGKFDYIVATGVLHHMENPAAALESLLARTYPRAVFRCMIYSQAGRELLYGTKRLAALSGADTPQKVRRLISLLPKDHPYRAYFHLYEDARTDSGLADGYLHPCDRPFRALGLADLLTSVGLVATRFLHRPGGQPELPAGEAAGPEVWRRLAVLELLGKLEENFLFFARRSSEGAVGGSSRPQTERWHWNPALGRRRRGWIQSKLLGESLPYHQGVAPGNIPAAERARLLSALLLIPGDCP